MRTTTTGGHTVPLSSVRAAVQQSAGSSRVVSVAMVVSPISKAKICQHNGATCNHHLWSQVHLASNPSNSSSPSDPSMARRHGREGTETRRGEGERRAGKLRNEVKRGGACGVYCAGEAAFSGRDALFGPCA